MEDTLRGAILSGSLKGGEMLPPETELASQFGVSRTTLREALRVLTSERLIRKVPGARGGNFVQAADHKALGEALIDSVENLLALGSIRFDEVAEVRQYLEVPSVRLAAQHRTDEDVTELQAIVKRQKSASIDDPSVSELDRKFHTRIASASGNRVLASLVAALHHSTEPVGYLALSPEVGRETVQQHVAIVRAITDQDPEAAEAAVVEHLTYLRSHIIAYQNE
ncbi:FadR/GntR family transcriptional regulator [Arthrobacter sp. NPDC080031]|uniref:FadR/GntR family transcriptional regulator n=1 Tax=Arthrobacter sp. NPDC080031 TaxID=3155918 RepID=UPI00344F8BFC